MPRTRVKICSICSPADARLAAGAGADAIGLIFHPSSKRYVTPDQAREILLALPPLVTPVAVTVDMPPDDVCALATLLNVSHVQLHGHETEETIAALAGFTLIKAVRVTPTLADDFADYDAIAARHPHLQGLLLETPTKQAGGAGVENDWSAIERSLRAYAPRLPLIAAGGLTSENVAAVIRTLRPHAVDVSSWVEQSVRVKSPDKVRSFINAARATDVEA